MIAETITAKNRPEAIEPYDKTWGVGVSGLDEDISPFPRVNRMLSKTKALFVSKVDTERARIMTESWLEKHKGEPALKRVANCFYDIISQVEIHIEEDELIVGEVGAAAWTAPLYPEFSTWLADELDQIDRGEVPDFIDRHNDKYIITDDQRKIIRELWAKWKGVNQGEMIRAEMHPEAKKGSGYIFANDLYTNNGIGHVTADYPKLMKLGYGGLRKLVEAKLAEIKLGDDGDELLKYEFWTAQLISLDAAELYFKRYGALAEKLAAECADPTRKAELERIASNCNWVATNPPRDYWEAIQLWYGGTCLILLESNGHSVTYGRFDQIMGPYYENDIKNGTLTRAFMQELIECAFIKMDHLRKIRNYPEILIASGIGWGGTALTVGGVDKDGNDAVNDVSFKSWGEIKTVDEVMKEVLDDKVYYDQSGGGITINGGEVTVQWEFTLELLKACREQGINTCVETCMYCEPEILEKFYPYTDLFLADIKNMDSQAHKKWSGAGNELILENLIRTAEAGIPLVIRIPILPEINNSEENIRATAEFIVDKLHNRVKQVQLLPYRKMGTEKYASMGIPYPMGEDYKMPPREVWEANIRHLVGIMQEYGVPAVPGSSERIEL